MSHEVRSNTVFRSASQGIVGAMLVLGRLADYFREVVATIQEVLAFDDPLLCDCLDDRWCADCSPFPAALPAPAPAPVDPGA